ncbi:hypothetical protein NW766_001223 [Fusarium irregulare]|uniref:Uncharacterized protein n=1 Tax=Fusarium irregulare TaxID=2494466 RepID=A0A9W8PZX7_9HYPO|nr:hypothetical protein NW766_001223 [Fusarium irregulare]
MGQNTLQQSLCNSIKIGSKHTFARIEQYEPERQLYSSMTRLVRTFSSPDKSEFKFRDIFSHQRNEYIQAYAETPFEIFKLYQQGQ